MLLIRQMRKNQKPRKRPFNQEQVNDDKEVPSAPLFYYKSVVQDQTVVWFKTGCNVVQ